MTTGNHTFLRRAARHVFVLLATIGFAAEGRVSQWNDKSGHGLHLTASGDARPTTASETINGHNVVVFDGVRIYTPQPVFPGGKILLAGLYDSVDDRVHQIWSGGTMVAGIYYGNTVPTVGNVSLGATSVPDHFDTCGIGEFIAVQCTVSEVVLLVEIAGNDVGRMHAATESLVSAGPAVVPTLADALAQTDDPFVRLKIVKISALLRGDGSKIEGRSAASGCQTHEIASVRILGEALFLYTASDGRVPGLALGASEAGVNGTAQELAATDFAFELNGDRMEMTAGVRVPTGFEWQETPEGITLKYGKTQ